MQAYINHYISVFIFTLALIQFFYLPAKEVGLVDCPGGRKDHQGEIPLVGGLAIFCAFTFISLFLPIHLRPFSSLYMGMAILLVVGIVDDLHNIKAVSKLVHQIAAAILMVSWGGVTITDLGDLFGGGAIDINGWSFPFTVMCVVGLINAINMIDGADGLAGGTVVIMGGWLVVAASLTGQPDSSTILMLFLSSVLAFLLFNFRHPWCKKAYVFLGDAGSMALGYVVAWFAVKVSQPSVHNAIYPISVLWILALPVFDTVTLMVRRMLKGMSPFAADREHLHHIFIKAGFSPAASVNILLLFVILTGGVGVAGWYYSIPEYYLTTGLFVVLCIYLYFVLHAWKTMKSLKRLQHWRT